MDVALVLFMEETKDQVFIKGKKTWVWLSWFCFLFVLFFFVPFVCDFSCMFLWGYSKAF